MKYTQLSTEREDILTPTNLIDVASAALAAYSQNGAVVAVAHHMFETAGGKACHNNNFGNAKSHPRTDALFTFFSCTEVVDKQVVKFDPPSLECCFEAFDTAAAGLLAHLDMMRSSWPEAEALLVSGSDDLPALARVFCEKLQKPAPRNGFVHAYFTDDVDHYTRGVIGELPNARAAVAIQQQGFSTIQAYQLHAYLTADGVIGPKTRQALGLP